MHGIVFHRPARTYPDALPHDEIVLVAPAAAPAAQKTPLSWLQFVIPVLGSLGGMMFLVFGSGSIGRNPLLLVGVFAMVILSILTGVTGQAQG